MTLKECKAATSATDDLIYLLDLLSPMEGQQRTPIEQVYYQLVLSAIDKLT